MQVIKFPDPASWPDILQRPVLDTGDLSEKVSKILNKVRRKGDKALLSYTEKFDGIILSSLRVTESEIAEAIAEVPYELKEAMHIAASNIERFHQAQWQEPEIIETMPGVRCWRRSVPVEKVGLYIPGGTAPLFSSILMLGIPARVAGCPEVILCTPPGKEGKLNPAVIYAAQLTGISKIFKVGGAQAIAAMAYGTETIPQVYKIFGPGNQYVTFAKQMVQQEGVAIDMPAGPSEVAVFADETADPSFIAADLLSQAEHGSDSQVILVTTDENLPGKVQAEVNLQLESLTRKNFARRSLANSKLILVQHAEEAIALLNAYAAEHLILACRDAGDFSEHIVNAGSVFLGHYSPESAGDYASGTNHTLPTNGYAKTYSGVSVDSFVKKITYQQLSEEGLANIANTVALLAEAEGLDAHKRAVMIRVEKGRKNDLKI